MLRLSHWGETAEMGICSHVCFPGAVFSTTECHWSDMANLFPGNKDSTGILYVSSLRDEYFLFSVQISFGHESDDDLEMLEREI